MNKTFGAALTLAAAVSLSLCGCADTEKKTLKRNDTPKSHVAPAAEKSTELSVTDEEDITTVDCDVLMSNFDGSAESAGLYAVEAVAEANYNPYAEIADEIPKQKYDPVVVNEGVKAAVEADKPEDFDISGYRFNYSGFEKVYSNDEMKKAFDRVQEICDKSNFQLSFSYMNIETGAYIGYGQYNYFMTCSTIKAPFIKSLLAEDVDLDTVIPRYYAWDGDGSTVASSPYGTEYTAKELIEYSIKESDNTAYYMLCNHFGVWGFNDMQYSLGSGYTLGAGWIFTDCTTDDMMKDYVDIYEFAEENDNGKWLVDMMSKCDMNMQIGQALGGKYKVAQKYGSEFSETYFNDCAIVYADSPFVLCIFTRQQPETEESAQVFKELAVAFDDINSLIYSE